MLQTDFSSKLQFFFIRLLEATQTEIEQEVYIYQIDNSQDRIFVEEIFLRNLKKKLLSKICLLSRYFKHI